MKTTTTGRPRMSQKTRIRNYLSSGKAINPLVAFNRLGVYRLSAVIYTLKSEGEDITTTMTPVKNRFGRTMHVASYRMAS